MRTHTCGELRLNDNKKKVMLCGWNQSRRDHGGIIFIDLRDRYGLTQVVFDPKHQKAVHQIAEKVSREDVLQIKGTVRPRGERLENLKLATGQIEVLVDEVSLLSKADTPPLEVDDRANSNEEIRLKYRYIDLRRPLMQKNLVLRHKVYQVTRQYLDAHQFLEIETPMLARSTPEGARDYLVPSRVHPGKFFALPQSPQLFKQLFMVSGLDRYFQIARCFRDEDLRADRQPEFTQIDIEMSFVEEEDIFMLNEGLVKELFKKVLDVELKIPFRRMTYQEAMNIYGSDKPDLRFALPLHDVSQIMEKSNFSVFLNVLKANGSVKCINAPGCATFSRKDIEELTETVKIHGSGGLAWMKMTKEGRLESSIVKFFPEDVLKAVAKETKAKEGDLLLFVADHKHHTTNVALGHLRLELGKRLQLINDKEWNFCWITDFPLLEYDEDQQRHVAVHHPFTSPKDEDMVYLGSNKHEELAKIRAKAYDLVLNGVEVGGGSIRIHQRDVQEKVFTLLGISKKEAEAKFGFLLEAFRYGAPPHGGIAFGLDRLVALMTNNESIREVIAFPKNKHCISLLDEAPSEVAKDQLEELNLKLALPEKKK